MQSETHSTRGQMLIEAFLVRYACVVRLGFVCRLCTGTLCVLSLFCVPCFARQDASESVYHVHGKVVDSTGVPQSDVRITSDDPYDDSHVPSQCITEADGTFSISHSPDHYHALKVFFYKPGYCCDFFESYSPIYKPFSVELSPDEPVTVEVRDVDGKPVSGASIAPYEVDFDNAFAIEPIGAETAARLGLVFKTNSDGIATVRGVPFNSLWSLTVSVEGHAMVKYQLPRSVDNRQLENTPIQLKWRGGKNTASVSITEADGTPATDVLVIATSPAQDFNRLVAKEPAEALYIMRKVDSRGEVTLNVADSVIELRVYSAKRGINKSIGAFKLRPNEPQHVTCQLEPICTLAVPILDLSNSGKLDGIELQLTRKENTVNAIAIARTNEDGIAEFSVEPGEWQFLRVLRGLPSGYVVDPTSFKVSVASSEETVSSPPVVIRKGRIIRGKIEGVDCASMRFDFVAAVYQKGNEEDEGLGVLDEHGNFEVTLPSNLSDSQITCMQISDSPVTNRRSLAIVSKEPWLLKYMPEAKVGIGLKLVADGDTIRVASIDANSPAALIDGLSIGSEVISLSSDMQPKTELKGYSVEEVAAQLLGPVGSQVMLRFLPKGQSAGNAKSAVVRRAASVDDGGK